jgi:hypothetical protein
MGRFLGSLCFMFFVWSGIRLHFSKAAQPRRKKTTPPLSGLTLSSHIIGFLELGIHIISTKWLRNSIVFRSKPANACTVGIRVQKREDEIQDRKTLTESQSNSKMTLKVKVPSLSMSCTYHHGGFATQCQKMLLGHRAQPLNAAMFEQWSNIP